MNPMRARVESSAGWSTAGFALVLVLAAVASASVFYVSRRSGASAFDPVQAAELAPADTHFFMALNTDFTSAPWLSVPRLLDALGIEDNVRKDISDSSAEEGMDFERELVPALATIRRLAISGQYRSGEEGEFVVIIDSRSPGDVTGLIERSDPTALRSERRDEALDLTFKVLTPTDAPGASDTVMTTHDGIIYVSDATTPITNLLRHLRDQGPLSASDRFRSAIAGVQDHALVVGYVSGRILDHPDFHDLVDAMQQSADVDPLDATFAFNLTAQDSGWGARAALGLTSGFGEAGVVMQPADVDGVARRTPEDAMLLVVGSGLGQALDRAYGQLEDNAPEFLDEFVAPFEELAGLSLRDDVIPFIGSTYGFALGVSRDPASPADVEPAWMLGAIESPDAGPLTQRLADALDTFEGQCECESKVVAERQFGYVVVGWPELQQGARTLDRSPAFEAVRSLLSPDPAMLVFVNTSALPEGLLDEWLADASAEPDAYQVDPRSLTGIAFALRGDATSMEFRIVVPIASGGGD